MVTGPRMAGNALVKLGKLTNHAKVNKMVSELPQAAKLEMFTNPQANQNIMQLLNIAPITQVQNAQQAVEKVSNAIQTGDLKGVGEDMKRAAKTYGK
jgi:cell division septation protein DedD